MSNGNYQQFTFRTYLYVTPPELDDQAIQELIQLCESTEALRVLNPRIAKTGHAGKIQLSISFKERDIEQADVLADKFLDVLLDTIGQDDKEQFREGSNLLTLA